MIERQERDLWSGVDQREGEGDTRRVVGREI